MAAWSAGASSKVLIDQCPAVYTSRFEQHYSRPLHPYPTGKRGIVWISLHSLHYVGDNLKASLEAQPQVNEGKTTWSRLIRDQ